MQVHSAATTDHRITPDSAKESDWLVICEHLRLAEETGLVQVLHRVNNPAWCVRLTSVGHDFCEEVEDATRWRKLLLWIAEKGAPPTIQAIVTAAAKIATDRLLG